MVKKRTMKRAVSNVTVHKDNDYATLIVKIISIFGYIGAGFGILGGIILLFGGQFLMSLLPLEQMPEIVSSLAGAFIIFLAVFAIAFCIFWIFVSRALWNYKNWARIVFLVFAALGAINSLTSLPLGLVSLLIDGAIVYFLGFDKTVIELFK
jgi:hypothetical protein